MAKKTQFKFKAPTVGGWIRIGIWVLILAFLTYIVIRLIPDESPDNTKFEYYTYKEPDPLFDPPEYVMENDKLRFELDPETTHFTLTQKDTGRVWYSNPVNLENDPRALIKEKYYMNSTLLLTYSTENGVNNTYDSFSYSVDRDYYTIEFADGGIKVNYIIGDVERVYIIPMAKTEDAMDEWLDKMKKKDSNIVKQYYRKYDIDNLNAQDDKNKLLAQYPMLKEENVYVIRDTTPEYMKERIETIFAENGYDNEMYEKDLEMYAGGKSKNNPMFNVSITYKLDGNMLDVDIPFETITFKKDYPLIKLAVLPYFGAAEEKDEGFLFVPEGGGALINFNNTKNRQNSYYADVYGWNYATTRKTVVNETRNSFPVFGIAYEDSSFISILDDGASYGGIYADISGRLNSYNYAYAAYDMAHYEQYDISSKSNNSEFAYERNLPAGEKILQKYVFVDSGNYVDMAKTYGKYLEKEYKLKEKKQTDTPLAVEIIGAVDKVQSVLGFPKSRPYALTTYSEATDILNEMDSLGFKNMHVKLSGQFNKGIDQRVLTSFNLINKLGGKKEFKKFIDDNSSRKLYLDGQVTYAKKNKLFDGFMMYRDSARFVSDEMCRLYPYSPIFYSRVKDPDDLYFLVKPAFTIKMLNKFVDSTEKYGLPGISFRDFGEELSCDFNEDRLVSREKMKKIQCDSFKDIKNRKLGLMINNGNDYALPYTDFITNMDFTGTKYLITDERIPFYQIAIHGLVPYTGEAVNLAPSATQAVLNAAAYGGGLYFVFTEKSTEYLQETAYSEYYGAGFHEWKDFAKNIYTRFNKELGGIYNKKITDFENITQFVSRTEYEDGTVVYVNRGNVPADMGGFSIPAEDYLVRHETAGNRGN